MASILNKFALPQDLSRENRIIIARLAAFLSLLLLAILIILYVLVANNIIANNHPNINNVDIQHMSLNMTQTPTGASLEALLGLETNFNQVGLIWATPKVASYTFSKKVNTTVIQTSTTSGYDITQSLQRTELSFNSPPVDLDEKETLLLQEMLRSDHLWVKLNGEYTMRVRLARFLAFPEMNWDLYFECNVLLVRGTSGLFTEMEQKTCIT